MWTACKPAQQWLLSARSGGAGSVYSGCIFSWSGLTEKQPCLGSKQALQGPKEEADLPRKLSQQGGEAGGFQLSPCCRHCLQQKGHCSQDVLGLGLLRLSLPFSQAKVYSRQQDRCGQRVNVWALAQSAVEDMGVTKQFI